MSSLFPPNGLLGQSNIRVANVQDLPAIIEMVERLHEVAGILIPLHRPYAEAFVKNLMAQDNGFVVVCEVDGRVAGMLIASIALASSISPVFVSVEHGWFVYPHARGQGTALLRRYVEWARSKGCFAMRMSTPELEDKAANILKREGFDPVEIAWAKVL